MIALWLEAFQEQISALNLFRYITVRAALAAATAFLLSLTLGPVLIRALRRRGLGESIAKGDSETLDSLHAAKESTPTMGGLLFLGAAVLSTVAWGRPDLPLVAMTLLVIVSCALIGFVDDSRKMAGRKGIPGKIKMVLLCVVAGLAASWLMKSGPVSELGTPYGSLHFPFFKNATIILGPWFLLLAIFVFTGTANAVNLTDGLDGLAIGAYIPLIGAFTLMTYLAGHVELSSYLLIPHVPGAGELSVLAASLTGAALGFLWFNCHPAEIFMGDTGSLALGGGLGFISLVLHQELVLLLAAGVFVVEALSVILQVGSFKMTGRRIFRCAPLHHHYEFQGLHENKIVVRFWILGTILAILAILTLKVR